MTIYVEDNEYADEVKNQLREVVNGDKSLIISPTSTPMGDIRYFQVTYQPATTLIGPGNPDLGKALINKLVNQSGKDIYIHGAHPFFRILVRGQDKVIQNEGGGFTTDELRYPHVDLYVDGTTNNQRYPITLEEPWLNMNQKFELPYVRLFHELLHADGLINQIPHSHAVIIPIENQLRTQRNFGYQREEPWCFIVSAASGSSTSKEVEILQQIRNELLRQNSIGFLIEHHVYTAYMRFSPQIAREITHSIQLRQVVLEIFVEPFIAFLVLARDYAFEKQDGRQMRQTIERVRRRLGERYTWSELSELSRLVGTWAIRLRSPASPGIGTKYPRSWEGADAESVLDYLLASINAEVPNDPYIIWAIRPLADMWEIVVDRSPQPEQLFIDRVHGWVADLPVPDELRQLPPEAVAAAIRELGHTVLKHEPLRAALSRRIGVASGGPGHDELFGSGNHATEIEELRC